MRITGGSLKGRKVDVPKGSLEIRPAMDSMRESLFAILGDLEGQSFLDLFSGSGVLALEAASRGAHPVVCVEKDRDKFALLLRNISIAERRIECHSMPVERFLLRNKTPFSIVFLDPPFPYAHRRDLLEKLALGQSLAEDGLVLIHYPREDRLPETIGRMRIEDVREYGRSIVRFYRASGRTGPSPAVVREDQ